MILLLLAAQITSAAASRDNAELTVQVRADGLIDVSKVISKLEQRRLVLQIPATLDAPSRIFHADHRYIPARREGDGVELEIPIGSKVSCQGPVSVAAIAGGLEAWVTCTEESAEAKANVAAPIFVEAATAVEPAAKIIEAKPVERAAEVKAIAAKPAEAKPLEVATKPKSADIFEAAAPALQTDLLSDAKKSSPIGAVVAALVVVLLGAAAYILRNRKKLSSSRIEVLETAALGPKRALILARVAGKTLLLASSESGISMLETVDDELHEAGPQEENEPAPQPALLAKIKEYAQPKLASYQPDPFSKLSKYLKPAEPQHFDALFAEEQEDQELRQKLLAGQSARTR
jgi:flagellar biogenesis protein FliO